MGKILWTRSKEKCVYYIIWHKIILNNIAVNKSCTNVFCMYNWTYYTNTWQCKRRGETCKGFFLKKKYFKLKKKNGKKGKEAFSDHNSDLLKDHAHQSL